ncbi:hypothetical protein B0J13DRAFT_161653 [Dactylonectria estremocensis]|uniref:Zn(2)-C6 fungal-type domain-containing protein n=1 Tax=Dactylonectria estremocensis TaxID=1079267 RepID=A0A9P9DKI6_9HYPO|nr:hypothetical protein B0J13DRAFT_161653 [Dactylonectria estremocensis]
MRRQNHSCDQCRKSKRACDAPRLDGARRRATADAAVGLTERADAEPRTRPCSYCLRTKKKCTMEWARSQMMLVGSAPSSTSSGASDQSNPAPFKRQRTEMDRVRPWVVDDTIDEEFDPGCASAFLQDASQIQDLVFEDAAIPDLDLAVTLPDTSLEDIFTFNAIPDEGVSQAELPEPSVEALNGSAAADSSASSFPQPGLDFDVYKAWQLPPASSISQSISSSQSRPPRSDTIWPTPKRRRRSSGWTDYQNRSISPFSMDQTMMARSNNQLISTNLLQIYHDVFEHNLSCWLTEVTCPYKTQRWRPDGADTADLRREWGPSWSNRIYRRTVKLDRVAQSTSMVRLARSEDQAVQRALHLSIMAFATQWAQGSRRQRQRYASTSDDNPLEDVVDEMSEEFDRNLQRHFWEQAQRALQDVADVESYRVVCAELIFGLTQKPWPTDDTPVVVVDPAMFSSRNGIRDVKTAVLSQLNGIISKEGPPTYIERAARKMHALKYRYDASRRGLGSGHSDVLNSEDKSTVGLLYWLAVMFDTVSSSMNERPVVVADEDCQHSSPQEESPDEDETASGRWKIDVFIQDDLEAPAQFLHWPCSYEAAAEAVTKSAPVKVLLFRHVSYLQNILRKGGRGHKVEEIIKSTTSIYRYWNMTYGSFFRELVQDFDAVPSRIQGWFVCISAHWHLAAMMLADMVEFVDENNLGVGVTARSRVSSKMASRIRETSVRELSDLASVATPSELVEVPGPQLPDFHHAVNEGTILTEPWTMILIRAFSKASVILLGEADESLRYGRATLGHDGDDFRESLERADECVKALWLLGKKSDMARRIAEVLAAAADGLRGGRRGRV